jgi:hypothetical protein
MVTATVSAARAGAIGTSIEEIPIAVSRTRFKCLTLLGLYGAKKPAIIIRGGAVSTGVAHDMECAVS